MHWLPGVRTMEFNLLAAKIIGIDACLILIAIEYVAAHTQQNKDGHQQYNHTQAKLQFLSKECRPLLLQTLLGLYLGFLANFLLSFLIYL